MIVIYCDGGSRGNPGPAASAYVVTENEKVIHSEGKYLNTETNNVAEYTAVLLATRWLVEQSIINKEQIIIINLDSQLVERQLNGFYKVKNENLKKLFDQIKLLIRDNSLSIKFQWGYRSKNTLADSLVNETLDATSKQ